MQRYTLMDQGDTSLSKSDDGDYYLAAEVDQRIAELEQCGKECSEGFRRMQERITDLERSLKSALLVIKQNENHSAVISRLAEQVIAEADKVLAL
jgi:hypothetical protein